MVTDDLDELVGLLERAVALMIPPWGIHPPRHMMTRSPRPNKGCALFAVLRTLIRKVLNKEAAADDS